MKEWNVILTDGTAVRFRSPVDLLDALNTMNAVLIPGQLAFQDKSKTQWHRGGIAGSSIEFAYEVQPCAQQ